MEEFSSSFIVMGTTTFFNKQMLIAIVAETDDGHCNTTGTGYAPPLSFQNHYTGYQYISVYNKAHKNITTRAKATSTFFIFHY